ncbi:hypothetical protein O7602_26770 [Micromonospora sp. WMMD1128]|uniref:hypothetical protein n=1 Tax=Micromonospora sp. WMMD1128 TaxID=3015150 RepID=UPI00248B8358|nr:hypothetical protein [Micromonospora sp. WMMD1128]WBB73247.1 hypothetical protein O7602_26770 [Micromonospora sp. WMMD1128]
MPSGGARTRSGPPPDPKALRRDRKTDGEWTILPAAGRPGDPPAWPLSEHEDPGWGDRETELWRRLWSRPQAVEWERQGQELEVALYVRRLVEAEQPGARANLATLVRQMADALGLTIPGLRTNRWKIAEPGSSTRARRSGPVEPVRKSARDRFQVIDGAAG